MPSLTAVSVSKPIYAEITGWGKCLPPALLSNADLSSILDTSDDWIFKRTGIRTRPISHVPVSELARVAALRALAAADLPVSEVEMIILGSCTADEQMPNTSSRIQQSIGAKQAAAVDINTACTSFMYAMSYASSLIRVGTIRNAVVIGADTLSAFMDWRDRRPSVVFGDGAGAIVLQATNQPVGILAEKLGCITSHRDVLRIRGIGTGYANASVMYGSTVWDFDGKEVFRLAVNSMAAASLAVLEKYGATQEAVQLVIPHQANLRIVESVARRLRAPMSKVFLNLEQCGNLSSASIPVALVDALAAGRIDAHNTILIPAFGGGMTWSAHLVRWGANTQSRGQSRARLPPTDKTALELVGALLAQKGGDPSPHLPGSLQNPFAPPRVPERQDDLCDVEAASNA